MSTTITALFDSRADAEAVRPWVDQTVFESFDPAAGA